MGLRIEGSEFKVPDSGLYFSGVTAGAEERHYPPPGWIAFLPIVAICCQLQICSVLLVHGA